MSDHPPSQRPATRISSRIKLLRQQLDMSQRELARESGLSPNTISLIERDETSPTADTLQKLADALQVKVTSFFEHPQEIPSAIYHTRAGDRPEISFHGGVVESLGTSGDPRTPIFPSLLTIYPGASSGEMMRHKGQEFVFCLSGVVQYILLDKIYMLEAGDSLLFRSDIPHQWSNPGVVPAQVVIVLHNTPEVEIARLKARILNPERVTQMGDV